MPERATVILFIIYSTIFAIAWAYSLWFFAAKSLLLRKLVFYLMSFVRMTFPQTHSLVLSLIYFCAGIAGIFVFADMYGLKIWGMLTFNIRFIPLIILGILAEVSLAGFSANLYLGGLSDKNTDLWHEVQSIPWISGLMKLPDILMFPAIGIAASLEEFFFRGVLLLVMTKKLFFSPWVALSLATVFFLLEQLLLLKTHIQIAIISCGCLAISIVGGLLVLYTGSIFPALLCHISFVIFYFGYAGTNHRPYHGSYAPNG
jgi:membrane protease YdiL (CAAX protease family)